MQSRKKRGKFCHCLVGNLYNFYTIVTRSSNSCARPSYGPYCWDTIAPDDYMNTFHTVQWNRRCDAASYRTRHFSSRRTESLGGSGTGTRPSETPCESEPRAREKPTPSSFSWSAQQCTVRWRTEPICNTIFTSITRDYRKIQSTPIR